MTKRQTHNGENVHLPFFIAGMKNQSFLSTPPAGPLQFDRIQWICYDKHKIYGKNHKGNPDEWRGQKHRKIIPAKLVLITLFVLLSLAAGYALCGGFIVCMDHFFNWIQGDFQLSVLGGWICRAVFTAIVFCNLGLWTFAVGMWKKSVPMTIVSSVVFIFLRQIVIASSENQQDSIGFLCAVTAVSALALWYTFAKWTVRTD